MQKHTLISEVVIFQLFTHFLVALITYSHLISPKITPFKANTSKVSLNNEKVNYLFTRNDPY